jgi:hypothetical protein
MSIVAIASASRNSSSRKRTGTAHRLLGLKRFAYVMLLHRKHPLFVDVRPASRAASAT